jgi:phage tail sheath gpL-like
MVKEATMALVAGAWMLHAELIDGTGRLTTISRRLVAADAAAAAAAATAHLALLTAVSDCKIVSYTVGQKYEENALGALPAVTVLNSVQAVISASIQDQPNKFATLSIPGPKITVFAGSSGRNANVVDVGAGIVTDYLADFTAAGHVFISDGEHLDPVYNATGERVTKYRRLGK